MEKIISLENWKFEVRDYDPGEDPQHFVNVDEYSGFVVKSKDVSKDQGFVKFLSKMAKKVVSSGFNVLNMTLPCVMLTHKSSAEIILYGFGGLALMADEAVSCKDPVQRMRLIQAGLCAGLCHTAMIMEGNPPFPNTLGGTLQVPILGFYNYPRL